MHLGCYGERSSARALHALHLLSDLDLLQGVVKSQFFIAMRAEGQTQIASSRSGPLWEFAVTPLLACSGWLELVAASAMNVFVEAGNAAVETFGEAAHGQHQQQGDAEEKLLVLRGQAVGSGTGQYGQQCESEKDT